MLNGVEELSVEVRLSYPCTGLSGAVTVNLVAPDSCDTAGEVDVPNCCGRFERDDVRCIRWCRPVTGLPGGWYTSGNKMGIAVYSEDYIECRLNE